MPSVHDEASFRTDVVEQQPTHSARNEVRAAYNRAEYLPERRVMMQHRSDMLDCFASRDNKLVTRNLAKAA
jgi:hypothetical protein